MNAYVSAVKNIMNAKGNISVQTTTAPSKTTTPSCSIKTPPMPCGKVVVNKVVDETSCSIKIPSLSQIGAVTSQVDRVTAKLPVKVVKK